jgi:nucleotide-binding universal stress UspA family protein
MPKSILVPTAGDEVDEVVFETALAAARPFAAHLEFLHVRSDVTEAARHAPHIGFVRGPAIAEALDGLEAQLKARSALALSHCQEFCLRNRIEFTQEPGSRNRPSAHWRDGAGNAVWCILESARHNDLTVLGRRRSHSQALPPELMELLLLGCGRPVLIAAKAPPLLLTGTILICWKESSEAARSLAFAMPFLEKADHVILVNVEEREDRPADALRGSAEHLAWHGIRVETQSIPPNGRSTSELLCAAARSCSADLVVMGAYGHSRAREMIFGGCAQSVVENTDTPLLVAH